MFFLNFFYVLNFRSVNSVKSEHIRGQRSGVGGQNCRRFFATDGTDYTDKRLLHKSGILFISPCIPSGGKN